MRNLSQVDQRDPTRILLTEVLPFELPLFFTNEKLRSHFRRRSTHVPDLVRKLIYPSKPRSATIPFSYSIRRGERGTRELSIMHPKIQHQCMDFYESYASYILNLCARSEFSLRFPAQVATAYVEPQFTARSHSAPNEAGDPAPSEHDDQRRLASTYFYYSRFSHAWKFYESTEFRRLEQDFRILLRLDVANCFPSLYTHSLSWLVRSKPFAKKNINREGFDTHFDRLMMNANWGETNGILVGPEISRIFAEAILQGLDLRLEVALSRAGVKPSELAVRRYIDDYFLFANSMEILSVAETALVEVLSEVGLKLNEQKKQVLSSPLITDLSVARSKVKKLLGVKALRDLKTSLSIPLPGEDPRASKRSERSHGRADLLIRDFKAVLRMTGVSYPEVCPYALAVLQRSLERLKDSPSPALVSGARLRSIERALALVLETGFFIFRMDARVNPTYVMARIVTTCLEIARKQKLALGLLTQEISNHLLSVISQVQRAPANQIELSCLLTVLRGLGCPALVSPEEVRSMLGLEAPEISSANYFALMTGLHFCADLPGFESVRVAICEEIRRRFSVPRDHHEETEQVLLFMDSLACPFVDADTQKEVIKGMHRAALKQDPSLKEIAAVAAFCRKNLGFVDWESKGGLRTMLERKDLRAAYG